MPGRKSQTERELRDLESASPSGSDEEQDQVGSLGAGPSVRKKKRKRLSDLSAEERFQNMPLKEKQKLSAQYRALQADADDMKQNLANTDIAELERKMREGQELFEGVRDPTLGALDARLMMTGAETALLMARKMKMDGNAFNVDEYLIRVKGILGLERDELEDQDVSDEEEDELDEESAEDRRAARRENARKGRLGDWAKIGWMAAKFVRRVPGVEFMYGPINTAPKPRINRTHQRRAEIEQESRPQEIRQEPGEPAGSDATTANVQLIGKLLRRRDPDSQGFNFFRFVINPDDFGQSVENCFYVSFLIKDGKAGIQVTSEGEVLIFKRNPFTSDVDTGKEPDRNQAVMELTMAAWETAKDLYNITEPVIPHRVYEEARPLQANRWYT